MASSLPYELRHSIRTSLSTMQNIQDNQSLNHQQSRRDLSDSSVPSVKNGLLQVHAA